VSAFVVDKAHIDAIVREAVRPGIVNDDDRGGNR
jgi:hypothetical protein